MKRHRKTSRAACAVLVAAVLAVLVVTGTPATAADGWKFDPGTTADPSLSYTDKGKIVFWVGCDDYFLLSASYPGKPPAAGQGADIVITNGRGSMLFHGAVVARGSSGVFTQADLGFSESDSEWHGRRWQTIKSLLLGLLASNQRIGVRAGLRDYDMPPVDAPGWFRALDLCGSH